MILKSKNNLVKGDKLIRILIFFAATILALLPLFTLPGCKHDIPEPLVVNDTTGNGGGNNGGGGGNGLPCNPDSIYFEQQILPFLAASCGKPGCHDATTHEEGIVINSYATLTNTVEVLPGNPPYSPPYQLSDSQLWESITTNDPDDRMPPQGEAQLTTAQINLISQWIQQGAQNLVCDQSLGPCDSVNVTWTSTIKPIIQNKCVGCHTTATSSNSFVQVANYPGVSAIASSGQLMGCITYASSYSGMPKSAPRLSTCEIGQMRAWVNAGHPQN